MSLQKVFETFDKIHEEFERCKVAGLPLPSLADLDNILRPKEYSWTDECPRCGEQLDPLPSTVTEQQARQALRAVILWYHESPIREIQMADAACCRRFPVKEIEAALTNGER